MKTKIKRTFKVVFLPKFTAAGLISIFVILLLFLTAAAQDSRPTNIILLIGDGMGLSQITAGRIVKGELNLDQFPTVGLVTTHSEDDLITDSAASMTAMVTGHKTYNKAISVSSNQDTLKTIFEYAKEKGMSTGLVVTCTVTHATPAACIAHIDDRNKHAEIAEQITAFDVDVLMGGGLSYFLPKSHKKSKQEDDRNLIKKLSQKMKVVYSVEDMHKNKNAKKLAVFLAEKDPPKINERPYTLAELTEVALNILSKNPKGFILMVEGSQIDWGGHDNEANRIIHEVIDFDGAVGVGLEFSNQNPNTLVVATADHETGGFAVHGGAIEKKEVSDTGFTSGKHTATMVPVFAKGPGEDAFSGIIDNTDIGKKLIEYIAK